MMGCKVAECFDNCSAAHDNTTTTRDASWGSASSWVDVTPLSSQEPSQQTVTHDIRHASTGTTLNALIPTRSGQHSITLEVRQHEFKPMRHSN